MLTNDVQIAYSQTEGYAPVTSKAQNSDEYQDYLSRRGEDNSLYYDIKIDATRLLMDNTDNTFVTPVFNGSASLRNAAGQMIEEVNKGIRRKKTVDDAFLDGLFSEMTSLYRLDQITAADGKITLGETYDYAVDQVVNFLECEQNTQYYGDTDFVLWKY
jgi:multiple sugar transport system substrate-binding protein